MSASTAYVFRPGLGSGGLILLVATAPAWAGHEVLPANPSLALGESCSFSLKAGSGGRNARPWTTSRP